MMYFKGQGLGDTISDIQTLISEIPTVIGALPTITDVLQDPYFSEIVCRVSQLKSVETGQAPDVCTVTPATATSDVGLQNVTYALRAYVFAEQNKWVYPVAIWLVLGLPLMIGFGLGKRSERRRVTKKAS